MEGMRQQAISAQAAVAAHLQAQQQAQLKQQQTHAHAQQQAVVAAAAQQQHRHSSFVWQQQQQQQQQHAVANNATAQMQNGYPNFMSSMMAMQANNATQMAMVATAKLAPSKKNKASSSNLAVRSTVPRFNVAGGIYSVAQWARKCLEDNLEFVVKIARRSDPKANLVMLAYGDGCQTLVFLDEAMNEVPDDLSKIKKIHVGVSAAPIDDKRNETDMAASGVLQPIDSLWDHLRYEQANATNDKQEKIMFIHTSMTVYGDSVVGRRRVLQIKTSAPKTPFVAESYMRNVMFEQQVLAKWKGEVPEAAPVLPQGTMDTAASAAVAAAPADEEEDDANEYLITFNPKELMLLEKAFDNSLTPRDLKNKADKWKDEDSIKCQATILRAQNEFKYVRPRKPNSKKPKPDADADNKEKSDSAKKPVANKDEPTATAAATKKPASQKQVSQKAKKDDAVKGNAKKDDAAKGKAKKDEAAKGKTKKDDAAKGKTVKSKESPKKAKRNSISKKKETKKDKAPTPKTSAKKAEKKENPVDSDDEPIVKLKTPAKKTKSKVAAKKESTPATKPKSAKKSANSDKKPKDSATKKSAEKMKNEEPSKKRGRDKSVGPPAKKTRSTSKPRSTRSKK